MQQRRQRRIGSGAGSPMRPLKPYSDLGRSLDPWDEVFFPFRDSCHRRQRYGERTVTVTAAKQQSSASPPIRKSKTRLTTIVRSANAPLIMNHTKVGKSGRRGVVARTWRLQMNKCETRSLAPVNIRQTYRMCPQINNMQTDRLLEPHQGRTTIGHRQRAHGGGVPLTWL